MDPVDAATRRPVLNRSVYVWDSFRWDDDCGNDEEDASLQLSALCQGLAAGLPAPDAPKAMLERGAALDAVGLHCEAVAELRRVLDSSGASERERWLAARGISGAAEAAVSVAHGGSLSGSGEGAKIPPRSNRAAEIRRNHSHLLRRIAGQGTDILDQTTPRKPVPPRVLVASASLPAVPGSVAAKRQALLRTEATAARRNFQEVQDPLFPEPEAPPDKSRSRTTRAAEVRAKYGHRLRTIAPSQEFRSEAAGSALEFNDDRFGIGPRFPSSTNDSPGPAAYEVKAGDVGMWRRGREQPSKQPDARHHSAQAWSFGHRRAKHLGKPVPGPGAYTLQSFTEDYQFKSGPRLSATFIHNSRESDFTIPDLDWI